MANGKRGKQWRLYYNTLTDYQTVKASYDTPNWGTSTYIQDITVNFTKEQLERRRRGGKVAEYDSGWGEFSIEFNMDYENTDLFLIALQAHFNAIDDSWMHLMVLDGENVAGAKGFEMPAVITTLSGEAPIVGKTNAPLVAMPHQAVVESEIKEWTPKVVST